MTHLAIDCVGTKHGGAATVFRDFLKTALDDRRIDKVSVFCSPVSSLGFNFPDNNKLILIEQPELDASRAKRVIWYEKNLADACTKSSPDILFCMSNLGRSRLPIPHVTFIQQSLPFSQEALRTLNTKRRLEMMLIRFLMERSCRFACRVIVQTSIMANWVTKAFNLPSDKVVSIMPDVHLASSQDLQTSQFINATSLQNHRLLYVGSMSPYKMTNTIVNGMKELLHVVPDAELLMTLPFSHSYAKYSGVICLGYLSQSELADQYRMATLVVQPSLVETIGLPMLEALSLGKCVLAADRPYAHVICEDAALYFNPNDSHDFAQKAALILLDDQMRNTLIERGHVITRKRRANSPYHEMLNVILDCL